MYACEWLAFVECVCQCVCVCDVCMCAHVCMCVCMCVCMYVCMYVLYVCGRKNSILNHKVFQEESLNAFMSLGRNVWRETRALLQKILSKDEASH